jgi:hypothetical protein
MLVAATIYFAIAVGLAIAWYAALARYARKRSHRVLQWIEISFAERGRVLGIQWTGLGRFRAHLQLAADSCFHGASVEVSLPGLQFPIPRFAALARRRPELLTFEADLDSPPSHEFELHRHRWHGRSRRKLPPQATFGPGHRLPATVIMSDGSWEPELACALSAVSSCREHEVYSISFRRTSPHFCATLPLPLAADSSASGGGLLQTLQELASGASAWSS